ncbi:MAG: MerR family transcriptional regulator [Planctomycetota bacterium]|jgi:excisionase family DNA binding protein
MARKFLSTGQAAELCSVTSDTILKWIRSGLLPARRTAGGHYRIDRSDLDRILNLRGDNKGPALEGLFRRFRYCWEYNGDGKVDEGCKKCAVYIMRAQRCYEVGKFAAEDFHPKVFCKKSCKECDYYKEVHEQTTNLLVVTDDARLAGELKKAAASTQFNLEIVNCEYSCSMAVDRIRPDFVIIDCSMGQEASRDITHHLAEDPRAPFVRILLAGNEGEFPNECEKVIFARLSRPFGIEDIQECIDHTMFAGPGPK